MSGQSPSSARPDFDRSTNNNGIADNRCNFASRLQDGSSRSRRNDHDNNNVVVVTKLMERKETTFGVLPTSRDGSSTQPRTVRFLNEQQQRDRRCSRRDDVQSSFSRQNCYSSSSSSSEDEDDNGIDGNFSYYTMTRFVQPKRERLKYVDNGNNNVGTVFSNKTPQATAVSKSKSRTKSATNNCIVS